MFDSYRMRSAQLLIKELLKHSNWNNGTDEYVSFIHLLSLYNRSEVYDEVRPFWVGTLSRAELKGDQELSWKCFWRRNSDPLYYCGYIYVSLVPTATF